MQQKLVGSHEVSRLLEEGMLDDCWFHPGAEPDDPFAVDDPFRYEAMRDLSGLIELDDCGVPMIECDVVAL